MYNYSSVSGCVQQLNISDILLDSVSVWVWVGLAVDHMYSAGPACRYCCVKVCIKCLCCMTTGPQQEPTEVRPSRSPELLCHLLRWRLWLKGKPVGLQPNNYAHYSREPMQMQ